MVLLYWLVCVPLFAVASVLPSHRPEWLKASSPALSEDSKTWTSMVDGISSMPQTWMNSTSDSLRRSSWTFSIGCLGAGAIQYPSLTDIYAATSSWFAGSDTGATCTDNEDYALGCSSADNPSQDGCYYQASYAVWNNGIMDCYAYTVLESNVLGTCVDAGWGDCGCGVYYDYGSGVCLVATYVYHVSGPSTYGVDGGPAEPEAFDEVVNVYHDRRDSTGPSYTDLQACAFNDNGDIEEWCEGSATHVC